MSTHDTACIANAEISVRENCESQLTAPAWDASAVEAENEWVTAWALEWLADGTSTCQCSSQQRRPHEKDRLE